MKKIYGLILPCNGEYDSNGLGLSMVKSIIKLHRGKITVKSEFGKGTKFRIVL